ncbi:Putative 5'(3')-deoxyribonucleotidase [Streptomyces sp. YIM 121038]|uniref:5' nucleotidase, NT5C type n=1 Tax=Streptomyces sp. YIM 121038 TaxID=2136401 RepID=UPI0011101C3D|nr:5'(3')-deoxyribonucleotidase [Streptomyces sp. YIM 121038]QCX74136.1 Putative 5'(3')-deoxyribonucleotidase [Streptomyces sp. YIM 121038]
MTARGRKVLAVDLDEVSADTVAKRLRRYEADHGEALSRAAIHGRQIRDAVPPGRRVQVEACLDEPGFSRDVPVMADARRVLRDLAERFEIVFATSAMDHPVSLHDRYLWLQESFPFVPDRGYVFCGSKQFVHADYLIDDNPRNLEVFPGRGLLFDAHHNVAEDRFPRLSSWRDVHRYFA